MCTNPKKYEESLCNLHTKLHIDHIFQKIKYRLLNYYLKRERVMSNGELKVFRLYKMNLIGLGQYISSALREEFLFIY